MKQLLILSGKGGTGKTTVAAAFIYLSRARAYADCDVDAPNLHLVDKWDCPPRIDAYYGMPKARIDPVRCVSCGRCAEHCRFDAVKDKPHYSIDAFACEGCGVCAAVCPSGAVTMEKTPAGELALYSSDNAVFSTAKLYMGNGTSGMLVVEVKKRMIAAADKAELAVIDGSPGIGCPVIASVSGVDLALIVAEPSLSGISDMERILLTAEKLGTKTAVCINKYDVNHNKTKEICGYCERRGIPVTGMIPFDPGAVKAVNDGLSIARLDIPSGIAVRTVYQNTLSLLFPDRGS